MVGDGLSNGYSGGIENPIMSGYGGGFGGTSNQFEGTSNSNVVYYGGNFNIKSQAILKKALIHS